MSWFYLILAIILEIIGTTSMKLSQGFTKTLPSIVMFIFYILSLISLTLALKKVDVSVAYAVWSGLGTTLIALIGIFISGAVHYYKDSFNWSDYNRCCRFEFKWRRTLTFKVTWNLW